VFISVEKCLVLSPDLSSWVGDNKMQTSCAQMIKTAKSTPVPIKTLCFLQSVAAKWNARPSCIHVPEPTNRLPAFYIQRGITKMQTLSERAVILSLCWRLNSPKE